MLRRAGLLLAAFLVIGGAFAAGLVVAPDDDVEGPLAVERPAARAEAVAAAKTVKLETQAGQLPRLKGKLAAGEVAPERAPRTRQSTADPLDSGDAPQTDLQDPSDPRGGGDAFALFDSRVVDRGRGIFIAEPSVASNGQRLLATWNFGAAFSGDGGQTFAYVDPRTAFPQAAGGYCCDQVAYYIPSRDLWVWYIQYLPDSSGSNVVRLAFAKGDADFDQRRFRYYDYSSKSFDLPGVTGNADLDYPNLAATDKYLFLSTNAFAHERYTNTVVMRIPLDQVAAGEEVTARYLTSALNTAELTDGAKDSMYFAQHLDSSTLRVWRWDDSSPDAVSSDVAHSDYDVGSSADYSCPRKGAASGDWCLRKQGDGIYTNDDRPTGGWVSGDDVAFAWNAPRSPSRGFPFPYSMVVRIDRDTMRVRDEPVIWNSRYAYQFANFAPNARGDVAGLALAGGGDRYQTCSTLISDASTPGRWDARAAFPSNADPAEDKSGDYLGVVPTRPGANSWTGACASVRGGSAPAAVEVELLKFGRAKDR